MALSPIKSSSLYSTTILLLLLALMIDFTRLELGFDVDDDNGSVITGAKFECLKNQGYKFTILKGYRSNNSIF